MQAVNLSKVGLTLPRVLAAACLSDGHLSRCAHVRACVRDPVRTCTRLSSTHSHWRHSASELSTDRLHPLPTSMDPNALQQLSTSRLDVDLDAESSERPQPSNSHLDPEPLPQPTTNHLDPEALPQPSTSWSGNYSASCIERDTLVNYV